MFGGTVFFIGLAAFLFFIYGRRKAQHRLSEAGTVIAPVEASEARK
jgi:hypothetical protein